MMNGAGAALWGQVGREKLALARKVRNAMLWDKKPVSIERPTLASAPESGIVPSAKSIEEKSMLEATKSAAANTLVDPGRTQLGRSLVVKGDVMGNEDLTIFGQFEGTVNLPGNCLTIGPEG